MNFADRVIEYYSKLQLTDRLPEGVNVLNPYTNDDVLSICKQFYNKYYKDSDGRIFIVGINPGRFGAGITGIPFTDISKMRDKNISFSTGNHTNSENSASLKHFFLYI